MPSKEGHLLAYCNLTQYLQVNKGRAPCGHVVANCQRNGISFVCRDRVALYWRVVRYVRTEICKGENKENEEIHNPQCRRANDSIHFCMGFGAICCAFISQVQIRFCILASSIKFRSSESYGHCRLKSQTPQISMAGYTT